MRHRRSKMRLKQKPSHARMFKRNLLTSLLLYESVRTTKKRAQVVAPEVDRLINFAKKNKPHVAIRYINKTVTDINASKKIMEVLIKRFAKKDSGLTRTVAAGFRGGDGADLVDLSLVDMGDREIGKLGNGDKEEIKAIKEIKDEKNKTSSPKKSS